MQVAALQMQIQYIFIFQFFYDQNIYFLTALANYALYIYILKKISKIIKQYILYIAILLASYACTEEEEKSD